MKLRQVIILCILAMSVSLNAQQISIETKAIKDQGPEQAQAKLGADQSLTIAPNPVTMANPIIYITTVNVQMFSYFILNSWGQIVELENLAGRPDPKIINLSGAVTPGVYFIRFDTDAGFLTRKFLVI
ncbi:MAG: T9SS type A sorting domain-containing protein [Chitinophagales bacterium]